MSKEKGYLENLQDGLKAGAGWVGEKAVNFVSGTVGEVGNKFVKAGGKAMGVQLTEDIDELKDEIKEDLTSLKAELIEIMDKKLLQVKNSVCEDVVSSMESSLVSTKESVKHNTNGLTKIMHQVEFLQEDIAKLNKEQQSFDYKIKENDQKQTTQSDIAKVLSDLSGEISKLKMESQQTKSEISKSRMEQKELSKSSTEKQLKENGEKIDKMFQGLREEIRVLRKDSKKTKHIMKKNKEKIAESSLLNRKLKKQLRNKQVYERNNQTKNVYASQEEQFENGEKVWWLRSSVDRNGKILDERWFGPYKILDYRGYGYYTIQSKSKFPTNTVHESGLRLYD